MGTGPRAADGADIALTELGEGAGTRFLVEARSDAGARLCAALPLAPANPRDREAAGAACAEAAAAQARAIDTGGLPERLAAARDHARWDDVAARCLGCANCTMVCPTCYCTAAEITSDLATGETAHGRRWDSCFTVD